MHRFAALASRKARLEIRVSLHHSADGKSDKICGPATQGFPPSTRTPTFSLRSCARLGARRSSSRGRRGRVSIDRNSPAFCGTFSDKATLWIWKLDRLARSLKQLIQTAEDLKGRGIGFVSLTDAIDTSSPGGMLVFHMLGAIAEFERALIRERTVAGLAEARRKGKTGGRPRRMADKDALAAKALLADGTLSSKEVVARFGVSKATLYRYIGARGAGVVQNS